MSNLLLVKQLRRSLLTVFNLKCLDDQISDMLSQHVDIGSGEQHDEATIFAKLCKEKIELNMLLRLKIEIIVSLAFSILNLVSDVYWIIGYYINGENWYFNVTLACVVLPKILNLFSRVCYLLTTKKVI